jgi:hypothetical protein
MLNKLSQQSQNGYPNSTNTCPNCTPRIKIIKLIKESDRVPVENLQNKLESDYTRNEEITHLNSPFRKPLVFKNWSLPCFYLGLPMPMLYVSKRIKQK